MKILILTTELTVKNGWGRYSVDLLNSLEKQGVSAIVAMQSGGRNDSGREVADVLPQYVSYRANYFLAFWYAWKLKKAAATCDVIHCFVEPYSLIAYFLSVFSGKKYVLTAHGTYSTLPYSLSPMRQYLHHKSFRCASTVVCVSEYSRQQLQSHNVGNLLVIHNGIRFDQFATEHMRPFSEREDLVLTVGALKYRKGQHVSLEAFAKVARMIPSAIYIFVGEKGDGRYFESLKQIAQAENLAGRVSFLSDIPDEELRGLYRKAKVFALTSISGGGHFEGFGLVYLEANANGVPVIGSVNSGAEGAILEGKTGFLISQEDSEAVARSMETLLRNEEVWRNMSEGSVLWAREHDWGKIAREYYDTVYGLL